MQGEHESRIVGSLKIDSCAAVRVKGQSSDIEVHAELQLEEGGADNDIEEAARLGKTTKVMSPSMWMRRPGSTTSVVFGTGLEWPVVFNSRFAWASNESPIASPKPELTFRETLGHDAVGANGEESQDVQVQERPELQGPLGEDFQAVRRERKCEEALNFDDVGDKETPAQLDVKAGVDGALFDDQRIRVRIALQQTCGGIDGEREGIKARRIRVQLDDEFAVQLDARDVVGRQDQMDAAHDAGVGRCKDFKVKGSRKSA